jgi:hypothetical protein
MDEHTMLPALNRDPRARLYDRRGMTFDDCAPAYRIGGAARGRYGDASSRAPMRRIGGTVQAIRSGGP